MCTLCTRAHAHIHIITEQHQNGSNYRKDKITKKDSPASSLMTAVTKFTITAMLESETMCIVRLWPQQLLQRDEDDSFTDRDFCSKIVFL